MIPNASHNFNFPRLNEEQNHRTAHPEQFVMIIVLSMQDRTETIDGNNDVFVNYMT